MRFSINNALLRDVENFLERTNIEFVEIGDGIVAIMIEEIYDIYFDTGRWKLKIKIKESYRSIIYPQDLLYVGVLPGRMMKDRVKSRDKVLSIVKQKLDPTAEHYKLVTDEEEVKKDTGFENVFKDIFTDDLFKDIFKEKK